MFPFEYPASTIAVAASAPYTVRQLFEIAVPITRWRVVVGNYNAFADAFVASGGLTGVVIAVGTPVFGSDGVWTGAMSAAGTVVQASTSIASGARLTTAWQDVSVGNIQPGQQRVLSYSFVSPANGNVAVRQRRQLAGRQRRIGDAGRGDELHPRGERQLHSTSTSSTSSPTTLPRF